MYTVKESCTLPSKGKIYDKPVLANLELRSMTTREEMVRQSSSDRQYKMLADLIEGCIVGEKPAIKVYDMCVGDYEYLLHKLRIVTYGPEYKMIVQCPSCSHIENKTFNLDDLEVMDFDPEEYDKLRTITLDRSGKIIHLKIQTPRIIDDIEVGIKEFKKRNKDISFDPTRMITLRNLIDTVDGNKLTDDQLDSFISELPAKDSNDLINRINELNRKVGLDTAFDYHCDRCGYDTTSFFRYGPEFFGPTSD